MFGTPWKEVWQRDGDTVDYCQKKTWKASLQYERKKCLAELDVVYITVNCIPY